MFIYLREIFIAFCENCLSMSSAYLSIGSPFYFYYQYLKKNLLFIMLLQLSQFPPFASIHPVLPFPPAIAPWVHVYGSHM